VNCTLCDETGYFFGFWRHQSIQAHLSVALHLLLAAEALAADVALVEAGHVASLVNHQVVRLGE